MTVEALVAGRCRHCECTETSPCDGGCAWTDDTRTLCTTCFGAVAILMDLVKILGITATKPKHGIHVARATWEALGVDEQRVLVMTCRRWLDGVQTVIAAELGERAADNAEELDAIAGFLLDKDPQQLASGDASLAATVVRLLEPHVGSRIVMP